MKCILGRDPDVDKICSPGQCAVCGWNPVELNRRERLMMRYGLQLGSDGLRRLVIGQGDASGQEKETDPTLKKPARGIWKTCEYCGGKFLAGNNNQRFCGASCRVLKAEQNKKEKQPKGRKKKCQGP